LLTAALQAGYQVYAAVRSSSQTAHLQALDVQLVQLSLHDGALLKQEMLQYNFDFVIHAAGTTKALSAQIYQQVNCGYTQNLAEAAVAMPGFKRFVFISSLAAIGPLGAQEGKILENSPRRPVTAYGKSKLAAENLLEKMNIPVTILRPTAIYGPREKDIFIVLQSLNKGIDAYIGKRPQQLSFVYATDMAMVTIKALEQQGFKQYNITDGESYHRYAFADICKKRLNKKALRIHLPLALVKMLLYPAAWWSQFTKTAQPVNREKLGELLAENWICDIANAKMELGFNPQYNLEKGLAASIDWYKQNGWLK
jgi:nucleoside-diphosphate-sugar epimerase